MDQPDLHDLPADALPHRVAADLPRGDRALLRAASAARAAHRRVAAHRLRRRDRPRPGRPAGRSGALPGIRKGRPAGPGDQRAEPGTAAGERPHAAVRRAYRGILRRAAAAGRLHVPDAEAAHRPVPRPARLPVPRPDGPAAGGLAGVRGGGIHAVHAQAGLRHGTRRTQPSPEVAGPAQPAGHRHPVLGTGGRRDRGDQHPGPADPDALARRAVGRK